MIRLAAAAVALLAAGAHDSPDPLEEMHAEASIVQQRVIIRVSRGDGRVPARSSPARWREAAGPSCIQAQQVAGAVPAAHSVDLVMRDNRRVRAQLGGRCDGLDYYRGLYVEAQADGQICAGRDAIRSRIGGRCAITRFRQLHPVPVRP